MKIKIATVNFWNTAFENDFLNFLINATTNNQHSLVTSLEEADIIISSVFGDIKTPPEKTILYTGENIRPDFSKCRYSLSFDIDDWDGRNFYLPFWMSRIAWPGFDYIQMRKMHTHGNELPIHISELINPRPIPVIDKDKFCAFFAGNPEMNRINLFRKICSYKSIDGYGLLFNKPFCDQKSIILRDYKFTLCAENDYFPGYVTEKLFDAYSASTIPIYYGGIPEGSSINKKAFIDFNFDSNKLLQQIIALDTNNTLFERMYSEPLLLNEPKIEPAIYFIRNCIKTITGFNYE